MSTDRSRRTASAGALFFDEQDRVLIVKPVYKAYWNLPGGGIDEGETPRAAATREALEELGLRVDIGDLLVTATVARLGQGEHVYYIFDGGRLTADQRASITLPASELGDFRFVSPTAVDPGLIPPHLTEAWVAALRARVDGHPAEITIRL